MPICNTDNFISQLQAEINGIVGDSCPWCHISGGGTNHTAAIKTDGTLWTWGFGSALGSGIVQTRSSPGTTAGCGTNWCRVSEGTSHTIAIKSDGTLWTWGCNFSGQLGDGTATNRCSPGTVAGGGTTWFLVDGGLCLSAAIKTDGTLWTWGYNNQGALGDGTTATRTSPGTVAGGGTNWFAVSSSFSTAAIKTDGTLWTWGYARCGVLGDGTTVSRSSPGTIAGGGTTWCKINIDSLYAAAIKCDGTLWTWGNNPNGQLGDGTTVSRSSPGTIAGGGTDWCQVSVGVNFSAIKTDGTLWTWGSNCCGSLGYGTAGSSRRSPGTIAGGGTNWCQISSSGIFNTRALKTDGTLWSWGCNSNGQSGNGTTTNRCSPGSVAIAPVASAEDFLLYAEAIAQVTDNRKVSVASSSSLPDPLGNGIPTGQMVFLEDRLIPVIANGHDWDGLDGRALVTGPKYCLFSWGGNNQGALGDGTTVSRCSPGTIWGSSTTWCQVSASFSTNILAIKTDGTLWTWGTNTCGRLGDGTTVSRSSPGTVAGGGITWCQVSGGYAHSSAIKTDGTLWTWGRNCFGVLGDGTTVNRCSPGTIFGGGTTWCQIDGKCSHVAAIKTDGTLWTWGYNNGGELGNGNETRRCSPGTVAGGGTTWCQVSGGLESAAIKCDGTLWTWGCNSVGQLGNGIAGLSSFQTRCSPGTVAGGGTTWCQVSDGIGVMAAIKTDGTLWTWGSNTQGRLGNGTTVNRCSPGTVWGSYTTWCQVFVACCHVAAIKIDGTIWTWGCNGIGQLGDGTTVDRCSPGTVAGGGTTWCQVSGGGCTTVAITRQ